jgi:hypothetical protein
VRYETFGSYFNVIVSTWKWGPQFVTIRTTVQLKDGTTAQTYERRVLTFRSDNDPNPGSSYVTILLCERNIGHRFPVNLGIGTFGVNSPLDVRVDGGGFALSIFLDVVEITRALDIDLMKKVTAGLEVTPYCIVSLIQTQ